MTVSYYVIDAATGQSVLARFRPAVQEDFAKTIHEHWQTDWSSEFIQQEALEKYALEVCRDHDLVGLGAYRPMPEGFLVYVEYIESAPHSNPTLAAHRKYRGIGAALLAFGVQLSIDYGYGGTIFLKAKTSEIREHYIRAFGAIPFSRMDPFLLLIDGKAAKDLFLQFLKED